MPTGRRWTYAEFDAEVDAAGPRAARARRRQGRPGRHLGAELRRVGAPAVRHGADRRDPGQHQPGLPHPRAGLRAEAVGRARLVSADAFKTSDYRAMVDEVRADCPALDDVVLPRHADWDALLARRCRGGRRGAGASAAAGSRPTTRSTSSTRRDHRLPQGRDALAPQHPQQRLLRRRALPATPRTTGSASRCPSTTASAW